MVRHGPFETHLRDAIALNRARAPGYARRTRGRSLVLSAALIGIELALLPVARSYDRRAAAWSRRGVPLLDHLFAPMSSVPEVVALPVLAEPPAIDPRAVARRVRDALVRRGFGAAGARLERALARLPADGAGCAMLRHVLESAHVVAAATPALCARAAGAGLPTPAPLLGGLLRLHLRALGAAAIVDRIARPMHRAGVPIVLADLPHPASFAPRAAEG